MLGVCNFLCCLDTRGAREKNVNMLKVNNKFKKIAGKFKKI